MALTAALCLLPPQNMFSARIVANPDSLGATVITRSRAQPNSSRVRWKQKTHQYNDALDGTMCFLEQLSIETKRRGNITSHEKSVGSG